MSRSVVVTERPSCDIHKYVHQVDGVPAFYDGRTVDGRWAFMCKVCFVQYGTGLGTGSGQRLIVADEVQ